MAMILCRECGQRISDKSKICIHCGYPMEERKDLDALAEEVWQLRSQVDSLRMDLIQLRNSLNIADSDPEEPEDLIFLEEDLVKIPSCLIPDGDPYPKYREDLRAHFSGGMNTLCNGSEIGEYYLLEGPSLLDALDPEGKRSPVDALRERFPKKPMGVHIRIRGKENLTDCDEAFFAACREHNVHLIRYVDEDTFYDYTTEDFYRVNVSMGLEGDLLEYVEGKWQFQLVDRPDQLPVGIALHPSVR